jgi:hypothetical protein
MNLIKITRSECLKIMIGWQIVDGTGTRLGLVPVDQLGRAFSGGSERLRQS